MYRAKLNHKVSARDLKIFDSALSQCGFFPTWPMAVIENFLIRTVTARIFIDLTYGGYHADLKIFDRRHRTSEKKSALSQCGFKNFR